MKIARLTDIIRHYIFGGRFDDKDGRFVLFHPVEESRHTATVFFSRVQQLRLVHGDPHR